MNKEQFFTELEEHLRGEVPDSELRDSVSYYRGYFSEQESLGKNDQEILDDLGDPRYIARSIVDARGVEHEVSRSGGYYDEDGSYNYEEYTETDSNNYRQTRQTYQTYQEEAVNDPEPSPVKNIMSGVIRIAVIIGILLLIGILLHALLPIILVIIVVVLASSLFRRS